MHKRGENERGFTLIELMVTVAVIGILAMVAFPSYQNAMKKNRRAAAQAALMDIAQKEQQYLVDNRSYVALSGLNYTVPSNVSAYYLVDATPGTGAVPSFTATATPLTGGSQLSDGALSITNTGVKTPSDKW